MNDDQPWRIYRLISCFIINMYSVDHDDKLVHRATTLITYQQANRNDFVFIAQSKYDTSLSDPKYLNISWEENTGKPCPMWLPLSCSYLYLNVIFTCPVIENFQWTKPVVISYLFYKVTFSLSQSSPFNTPLAVFCMAYIYQ